MNPPMFLGYLVGNYPNRFIDEVKKIFGMMQLTGSDMWNWHPTNIGETAMIGPDLVFYESAIN